MATHPLAKYAKTSPLDKYANQYQNRQNQQGFSSAFGKTQKEAEKKRRSSGGGGQSAQGTDRREEFIETPATSSQITTEPKSTKESVLSFASKLVSGYKSKFKPSESYIEVSRKPTTTERLMGATETYYDTTRTTTSNVPRPMDISEFSFLGLGSTPASFGGSMSVLGLNKPSRVAYVGKSTDTQVYGVGKVQSRYGELLGKIGIKGKGTKDFAFAERDLLKTKQGEFTSTISRGGVVTPTSVSKTTSGTISRDILDMGKFKVSKTISGSTSVGKNLIGGRISRGIGASRGTTIYNEQGAISGGVSRIKVGYNDFKVKWGGITTPVAKTSKDIGFTGGNIGSSLTGTKTVSSNLISKAVSATSKGSKSVSGLRFPSTLNTFSLPTQRETGKLTSITTYQSDTMFDFDRTRPTSNVITPIEDTRQKITGGISQRGITTPTQDVIPATIPAIIPIIIPNDIIIPKQKQEPSLKPPIYKDYYDTGFGKPSGFSFFIPPFIPSGSSFGLDFGKGKRKKQPRRYTSTSFASAFNIKGSLSKLGVTTGLGLRPLLK